MDLKVSKTKSYGKGFFFSKEAFLSIIKAFQTEGFQKFQVKIPSNFEDSKSPFLLEEFINLEYNFKAIILVAEDETSGDLIKILFVNQTGTRKSFNDYTFPNTESEDSKFYVSSQSQIRLNGLVLFVQDTLRKYNLNKGLEYQASWFFNLVSLTYIVVFGFFLVNEPSKYFLLLSREVKVLFVVILPIALAIPFIHYVAARRGLYIKNFENPTISFINQILAGNFKDNPIIYTLSRLFGAVVLGVLIWAITAVLTSFVSS